MINIVFITDKNYVFPTKVAVKSIIANKNKETKYNINIIGVELDENDIFLFRNLETDNVKINIIQKDNDYSDIGFEHQHVSKAALFKFQIPNIFSSLDKILYLDGDMIIEKDLTELYSIDLKDNYAAVVKDYAGQNIEKHNKKINHKDYFNSGMMLLNLDLMRKNDMSNKLLEIKKNEKFGHFMDQDALNVGFEERVIYLSPTYNLMLANLKYDVNDIVNFYNITEEEFKNIKLNPTIIHLTNKLKPWNDINAVKSDEFWKYADSIDVIKYILNNNHNVLKQCYNEKINLSEEQNTTLKQRITNLEQKISFLEKKLKLPKWLGNLICGFIPSKKNRHNFRKKYIKNN